MASPWKDADMLRRLYWGEGMSLKEVSDELDCSNVTVLNWMKRHGIQRRAKNKNKPPSLSQITTGEREYEGFAVRDPDGSNVTVRHHRLLAVAEYGFDAVAGNDIHHKNGVPWDNRPSNIEPIDPCEHSRIHAKEQTRTADGSFV